MKKLIGMIVILLTFILSIIYRQLTARPVREKQPRSCIPVVLREGVALSYLLLQ
jgi:hypothetical protein